jgi:hypothetical protein
MMLSLAIAPLRELKLKIPSKLAAPGSINCHQLANIDQQNRSQGQDLYIPWLIFQMACFSGQQ